MMMNAVLVKYLLDEASENEQTEVEWWMAETDENKRYFEQFKFIWEESKNVKHQSKIEADDAWRRFESRLKNRNSKDSAAKSRVIPLFWKIPAVACIAIAIGMAGYFFSGIKIASGGQVLVKVLPDRSIITLNKNSTLSYNKSFNENKRLVKLSGEAFFKIAPDKQKPFIIKVGEVTVRVVGTSFNVKQTDAGVGVIVETGIVSIETGHKKVAVFPHHQIFISKDSDQLLVEASDDELYKYYRTHSFICNNTALKDLVAALNESFEAQIEIVSPEAANLKLTTRFQNESLKNILEIIAATVDVSVEYQKSGKILIK